MIGCIEEIAFQKAWINKKTLKEIAEESNGSWRDMSYLLEQCCNKVKPKLTLV